MYYAIHGTKKIKNYTFIKKYFGFFDEIICVFNTLTLLLCIN